MDCIDTCREGAISFTNRYAKPAKEKKTDTGRRAFFISSLLIGSSLSAKAQKKGRRKVEPLMRVQEEHKRETPIVPPGAISAKNFFDHCTSCQLCINACPNHVLRPSSSLNRFMQPEMAFDKGYCRPECNLCSNICPTGAIKAISVEEKSSIQTGHAVVDLDLCVVNTDDVDCGNCSRHCPVGAIRMVKKNPEDMLSIRIPAVDEERCIGCGACEHLCPARPVSAIHVEGHEVHKMI